MQTDEPERQNLMSELTLTLDVGNTNPHVGWFVDGQLKQVTKLSEVTEASEIGRAHV